MVCGIMLKCVLKKQFVTNVLFCGVLVECSFKRSL